MHVGNSPLRDRQHGAAVEKRPPISGGTCLEGKAQVDAAIGDAEIIDFDIKSVSDMEPTIFDMQLFNVMTIAYDSCMTIGIDMKEKIDAISESIETIVNNVELLMQSSDTMREYDEKAERIIEELIEINKKRIKLL